VITNHEHIFFYSVAKCSLKTVIDVGYIHNIEYMLHSAFKFVAQMIIFIICDPGLQNQSQLAWYLWQ